LKSLNFEVEYRGMKNQEELKTSFLHVLKPNKKKLILTLLLTFCWGYFVVSMDHNTYELCVVSHERASGTCVDYSYLSLFKERTCDCMSIPTVIFTWFLILGPGLAFYLIYSIIEYIYFKIKK